MRIGIDARMAYYNWSGIRRYTVGLLNAFASAALPDVEFTIYQSVFDRSIIASSSSCRTERIFSVPRMPGEEQLLSWELRRQKLDLFHAPDFFSPLRSSVPLVFTVHDLHFLKEPATVTRSTSRYYHKLGRYLPRAAHVISDSRATAEDLQSLVGASADRLSVIYPGIDAAQFTVSALRCEQVKAALKLPEQFLLMVGTIEPRKNHQRVFAAYRILKQKLGSKLPPLVVVGKKGHQAEKILAAAAENGVPQDIRYLGLVSETKLRAMYSLADILLYPSLYEGFGFPILEAMASKTAVITAGISSMPEVGGDAVLYVDPQSGADIAEKIELLLSDRVLHAALVAKGLDRVRQFSWQEAAQKTLAVYRMVLNGRF